MDAFCRSGVWADEAIELDPDARLQQAIRLVLQKFDELGSTRQVLLWLLLAGGRVSGDFSGPGYPGCPGVGTGTLALRDTVRLQNCAQTRKILSSPSSTRRNTS